MKKRIISMVLALIMLFGLVPMSAIAETAPGEGVIQQDTTPTGEDAPVPEENPEAAPEIPQAESKPESEEPEAEPGELPQGEAADGEPAQEPTEEPTEEPAEEPAEEEPAEEEPEGSWDILLNTTMLQKLQVVYVGESGMPTVAYAAQERWSVSKPGAVHLTLMAQEGYVLPRQLEVIVNSASYSLTAGVDTPEDQPEFSGSVVTVPWLLAAEGEVAMNITVKAVAIPETEPEQPEDPQQEPEEEPRQEPTEEDPQQEPAEEEPQQEPEEETDALYQRYPQLEQLLLEQPELALRLEETYRAHGEEEAFSATMKALADGTLPVSELGEILDGFQLFAGLYAKSFSILQAHEELQGLEEIRYNHTLTFPVKVNGTDCTVSLSDVVLNSPTQEVLQSTALSGSASYGTLVLGTPSSGNKQSLRYPVTLRVPGAPDYHFEVTFSFDSLSTLARYSVSTPVSQDYLVTTGTLSGSYKRVSGNYEATQSAQAFQLMERMGDRQITVNWNDNNASDRPTPDYTLWVGNSEVPQYTLEETPLAYNQTAVSVHGGDLPMYDNSGNPIAYTVRQSPIDGELYQVSQPEGAPLGGTLVNTRLTRLRVEKLWYDDTDQDGLRPSLQEWLGGIHLYSQVYANNALSVAQELSYQPSQIALASMDPNRWFLTIARLPMYDQTGNPIEYSITDSVSSEVNSHGWHYANQVGNVKEFVNAGYITDKVYDGGESVSTRTADMTLSFYKQWQDGGAINRPDITLYLHRMLMPQQVSTTTQVAGAPVVGMDAMTIPGETFADGSEAPYLIEYTVDGNAVVPRYDAFGKEYLYYANEAMSGPTAGSYTNVFYRNPNGELQDLYLTNGGTVTNSTFATTSIFVQKQWDARSVMGSVMNTNTSATFVLQKRVDGQWQDVLGPTGQPYQLTLAGFSEEQAGLQGILARDLPLTDANLVPIEYRVAEHSVLFLGQANDEIQTADGRMTAFQVDKLHFTVEYSQGMQDDQGNLIFAVTNSMKATRDVQVRKLWSREREDVVPQEDAYLVVQFYRDNAPYALSQDQVVDSLYPGCQVMEDGRLKLFVNGLENLAAVVRDLPAYDPETGSSYIWTALEVDGYGLNGYVPHMYSVNTQQEVVNPENGTVHTISIFNTYSDPGEAWQRIVYMKHWRDGEAASTRRPVLVQLYHLVEGGEEAVGEPVLLSDDNSWYQEVWYQLEDQEVSHYVTREVAADNQQVIDGFVTTGTPETGYTYRTYSQLSETEGVLGDLGYLWVSETYNQRIGTISLSVDKTWNTGGAQYQSSFAVYRNGEWLFDVRMGEDAPLGELTKEYNGESIPVTVTSTGEGLTTNYAFTAQLNKYDPYGFLYIYDVKETSIRVDGQESSFTNNKAIIQEGSLSYNVLSSVISDYYYGDYHSGDRMSVSFTNTFTQDSSLVVYKLWRDVISTARPDIVMALYRRSVGDGASGEGMLVDRFFWDTRTNPYFWMCTFGQQRFPMFDEQGYRYEYYVVEEVLNGYLEDYSYSVSYYNGPISNVNARGTSSKAVFSQVVGTDPAAICGFVQEENYSISPDNLVQAGMVVNTLNRTTMYRGTKLWLNLPSWFAVTEVPDILVGLFRQDPTGETPEACVQVQRLTDGNRFAVFDQVVRYDMYGNEYLYSIGEVEEVEAGAGAYLVEQSEQTLYVRKLSALQAYNITFSGGVITNTYHGGSGSLQVDKTWTIPADKAEDGTFRYPAVTFRLTKSFGQETVRTIDAIKLTLPSGSIAPGETVSITPHLVDAESGSSTYVDSASVTARLVGDKVEILVTATLRNLPLYAPDNSPYSWAIAEAKVNGYNAVNYTYGTSVPVPLDENNHGSVRFVNDYDNTRDRLTAKKLWVDSDNAYGTRPDFSTTAPAVTLELLRNGVALPDVQGAWTVASGNEWTYLFTSETQTFPAYDTAGNAYVYTVREHWTDPDSYAAKYYVPGYSTSQPTATNRLNAFIRLFVDKSWVDQDGARLTTAQLKQLKAFGYAPDSVTFQVYYQVGGTLEPYKFDGQDITMEVPWEVLYASVANNTLITFVHDGKPIELPKYDSENNLIHYVVREVKINDTPVNGDGPVTVGAYTFEVTTGNVRDSGTTQTAYITNKLSTKTLRFVKFWDDDRNRDGLRPGWNVANPQLTFTVSYDVFGNPGSFVAPNPGIGATQEWTGRWVLEVATNTQDIGKWTYEITVPMLWNITGVVENHTGASWEQHYQFGTFANPETNLYTVTNTHEPATFNLAVQKVWYDDDNAWNTRTEEVELTVKQDGNPVIRYAQDVIATIEEHLVGTALQSSGTTSGLAGVNSKLTATVQPEQDIATWYKLPINRPKTTATATVRAYTYTVAETPITGYSATYSALGSLKAQTDNGTTRTLTVTNSLNYRQVEAKKTWSNDYNNAFDTRVGDLVFVLTVKDNAGTLNYIRKNVNGAYVISPEAPADVADAVNRFLTVTIDSTSSGATARLTVPIPTNHPGYQWATARLLEVNSLSGYTPTDTSATATNPPRLVTTTVNTLTDTIPIVVRKTWDEVDYEYSFGNVFRPTLWFDIWYRIDNGSWVKSGIQGCADVSDSDPATTEYTLYLSTDAQKRPLALPRTTADGRLLSYDARETSMTGYYQVPSGHSYATTGTGVLIEETNEQQRTDVTVRKVWAGDSTWLEDTRPASVTLTLQARLGTSGSWTGVTKDGAPVQVVLSSANSWQATVTGLAARATGGRILYYRFVETETEGYMKAYSPVYAAIGAKINQSAGTVLTTNTLQTVTLSGRKVWAGDATWGSSLRESIQLKLYRDGVLVDASKYAVNWSGWSYSISGLPKADKLGHVYTYRVEEDTGTVSQAYTVTDGQAEPGTNNPYQLDDLINTLNTIELVGTKVWDDDSNRDGLRPDLITLKVYQNGVLLHSGYTLTWEKSGNTWSYRIQGLPRTDAEGNAYTYTVTENPVSSYETSYGEERASAQVASYTDNGTVRTALLTPITNTHVPEKTDVEGSKTWIDARDSDGIRPDTITIRLHADGVELASKVVTKDDNWEWSFKGLNKYNQGVEIQYIVTEDPVPGYSSQVSGYNVTNTREEARLHVRKVDEKGNPLPGATFHLYPLSDPSGAVSYDGGVPVKTQVSGENGIADFGTVPAGQYYLVEYEPPRGYEKTGDRYRVNADADGVTLERYNGTAWVVVPDFVVVNNRSRTDVTLLKQVTGELGNREKDFSFTVRCTEAMEPGEGYTLSADGLTATFTLRHNQSVTLQGVPLDAQLTVSEHNAQGYTTTLRVGTDSVTGPISVVEDLQITVDNNKPFIPDTGVLLDSVPYVVILSGVALGAVLLLARKRRKEEE